MTRWISIFWLMDYFTFCISSTKSSSKSESTNTTNNIDKRLVVDGGSLGVSSDHLFNSSVSINTLDAGAVNKAFDFAGNAGFAALDFANKSLSSMIALQVNRDKVAVAAAEAVTDSAVASIATIGQTAAEAVDKANAAKVGTEKGFSNLIMVGVGAVGIIWGLNK